MKEKVVRVIDLVIGDVAPLTVVSASEMTQARFHKDYVLKQRPVLIKGGIAEWDAVQLWKQSGYMENFFGEAEVSGSEMFNTVPWIPEQVTKQVKINEFIARMRSAPDDCTLSMPAFVMRDEWNRDFKNYAMLDPRRDKHPIMSPRRRMFIYKNASTEWHYHIGDETLTAQIVGAKRVSLFRTTPQNHKLIKMILEGNLHHMDCGHRFFNFEQKLKLYEGVMDAGDVLYIPPHWYHGIDPVDAEVGCTLAHCFRSPSNRIMSFKENIFYEILEYIIKNFRWYKIPLISVTLISYTFLSTFSRKLKGEKWFV